ncbi:hypothetical protein RK21_05108 [Pseudomonas plecoglossicida]|nr:hypothetical protein RK21_05108 [Pseudomonas plecoglossicida]
MKACSFSVNLHRWLYVNGDYVLVAIASGVIVNVLSGY